MPVGVHLSDWSPVNAEDRQPLTAAERRADRAGYQGPLTLAERDLLWLGGQVEQRRARLASVQVTMRVSCVAGVWLSVSVTV